MGRKRLRDGARATLLISLNPFEESDVGVRVIPGLVHILQSQEVRFSLRVATALQQLHRMAGLKAIVESVSGQSGRTEKDQRNSRELQYLTLGRVLRSMPCSHVRYFMGHDARQLRLLLGAKNQTAIYIKESSRQREGIDLVGIDHLDREWSSRIRIAH